MCVSHSHTTHTHVTRPTLTCLYSHVTLSHVSTIGEKEVSLQEIRSGIEFVQGPRALISPGTLYKGPGTLYKFPVQRHSIAGRGFVRCVNLNEFDGFVKDGS